MALDTASTLHQRIRADIGERIRSGAWSPGHRIPFEHELMAQYGCSRMTVNKALSPLAERARRRFCPLLGAIHRKERPLAQADSGGLDAS